MPIFNNMGSKEDNLNIQPGLKICITTGLSKKDIEKAGVTVRHAITKVMTRKTNSKLTVPIAQ